MQLQHVRLVAKDPARTILRQWQIEPSIDLFGHWTIRVTFGRIGQNGQTFLKSFDSEDLAARYYRAALRRRATAPRRIGVSYNHVETA
jgi:predicted DNA-binding WGR domain protein